MHGVGVGVFSRSLLIIPLVQGFQACMWTSLFERGGQSTSQSNSSVRE